ncbi:MAG TPA: hypothetical protein VIB82_03525 [Caulobacteraceae bacterium]|jgi:hypothetical protein
MAGSNAVSKWIDPEPAGREAAPLGRGRGVRQVASERGEIDRYHNNESLSPEAMSKVLADLQETVVSLEARVAVAEAGSASVVGAAKGLGLSMLNMGDALAKRISSLEETAAAEAEAAAAAKAEAEEAALASALFVTPPAQARKTPNRRLLLAGGAVVVAAVVGFVFLRPHAPTPAAPAAQVLYSPSAAAPTN